MKKIFSIILLVGCSLIAAAQKNSLTYPIAISFHSMCCGVPSDQPVLDYVKIFKKKYRIKKIAYDNYGPQGKEGEYTMAFPLKELNAKQRALFIKNIKLIAPAMKEQGNAQAEVNLKMDAPEAGSREKKQRLFL